MNRFRAIPVSLLSLGLTILAQNSNLFKEGQANFLLNCHKIE
jgi:hypothetical protein